MNRKTRLNPLATARDLVAVTTVDAGGGNVQFVIGGISGPTFTPNAAVWSGITGKPMLTIDGSTTAADITAWLAVPYAGWKQLIGSATLHDSIIIPSNTFLDATGATITMASGTHKHMIQNTAVTPLRSTGGTAVCTAGSHTVSGLTGGAFTNADKGRVLQVAFVAESTYGSNVYGTITNVNSSTSVDVDVAPLYTETGGVARVYGRDKNIHIRGGIWDHGTNDGAVLGNFIHMRRIDHGSVTQLECYSTAGAAYAVSPADVTDFLVEHIRGNTFSNLVQWSGPGTNIAMRHIRGVTGDDITAFTTSDYGPWNDTHGSYDTIDIEDIVGDAGTARMVLLATGALTPLSGTPAMPDGHSMKNVTVDGVTFTGSASSYGVTTWVQQDDPGSRIENLTVKNVVNCPVNLLHNAHGKVQLENINGDVTVGSMASPYPVTASVTDDLTVVNCTGMIQTNDARVTLTKLTVRGGSIPYLYLSHATIGSILVDGAALTNRLFFIENAASVGTLTFAHCTGITVYTAGIGYITGSSSVGEVNFQDCNLASTATTNGALTKVFSGSSLGTLRVSRSTIKTMGDILVNASAAQVKVFLSDVITTCERIVEGAGGAIVKYANVYFDGTATPFYANGNMTLSGTGYSASAAARSASFYDLQVAGGTVHVIDPQLQVDVSTLAMARGDMANNGNGALGCSYGPATSDGSHWKNIYTGATY